MKFLITYQFEIRLLLLLAGLSSCISCNSTQKNELKIAIAANMQYAVDSLIADFEKETNATCTVILGSSGKLATQIVNGAPFDLFIAADTVFPSRVNQRLNKSYQSFIYAYGQLILWSKKYELHSTSDLKKLSFNKIAIANPKTAPYGLWAESFLEQLDFHKHLSSKIIYGEDVAQTNQYIETKTADLGITALSSIYNPLLNNKGSWLVIDSTNQLPQSIVLLNDKSIVAQKFFSYMQSAAAKNILKTFGYKVML